MRKCIITAAENMSENTYAYLCVRIHEKFGGDIEFTRITDNAVLGGFIMELDGTVWDLSLSTQLGIIRQQLKAEEEAV